MNRLHALVATTALTLLASCTSEASEDRGNAAGNGAAENNATASASLDIVETALDAGSFGTLAKALTAAGLVDTLKGEGPFTVFAPTDDAFAKVPAAALTALLADKEKLTGVLTYHVVAGKNMAADVVGLSEVTTVQGGTAAITKEGDAVQIAGATIVKTDIECSNGVIHVIDTVMMPQ